MMKSRAAMGHWVLKLEILLLIGILFITTVGAQTPALRAVSPNDPVIAAQSPNGGETWSQSPFGGFLVLPYRSSAPAYANADDHPDLDVTGSLTVEALVYYEGDYWWFQGIVNKFDAYMLYMGYSDSGTHTARCIGFDLWPESGSVVGGSRCHWPPDYSSGQWHHVAGVFDADAGEIRTYIDGNLYSGPELFSGTIDNSSSILQVGYRLVGGIDELRISDMARYTGSTYTVTLPFTCDANTRALWHFDEPEDATVFRDACGSTNLSGVAAVGANNYLVGYNGAHVEGTPVYSVYLPLVLCEQTVSGP